MIQDLKNSSKSTSFWLNAWQGWCDEGRKIQNVDSIEPGRLCNFFLLVCISEKLYFHLIMSNNTVSCTCKLNLDQFTFVRAI